MPLPPLGDETSLGEVDCSAAGHPPSPLPGLVTAKLWSVRQTTAKSQVRTATRGGTDQRAGDPNSGKSAPRRTLPPAPAPPIAASRGVPGAIPSKIVMRTRWLPFFTRCVRRIGRPSLSLEHRRQKPIARGRPFPHHTLRRSSPGTATAWNRPQRGVRGIGSSTVFRGATRS